MLQRKCFVILYTISDKPFVRENLLSSKINLYTLFGNPTVKMFVEEKIDKLTVLEKEKVNLPNIPHSVTQIVRVSNGLYRYKGY